MQKIQYTQPRWQRLPAAVVPAFGWLDYLRSMTLAVWLFSQLFQFWWISDWFTSQRLLEEGVNMKQYFFVGFGVMLTAYLTLGPAAWIAAPFQLLASWSGACLTIFFVLMALTSPLSLVPLTSVVYAVATWTVVVLLWLFWTENYAVLKRALLVACWTQFAWWLALLLRHGLYGGFGGTIGDINRNITGTAALAAMICGLFTPHRYLRWAAFAAAALFCVVVSSRGSLVALAVFVIVYYTLYAGVFRSITVFGVLGVLAALIALSIPELRQQIVDKVFHIYDSARGVGSGFTGRVALWKQAIHSFWKNPIIGYGFRATSHAQGASFGGVHSAYLKILLEAGFVGAIFVFGAVVGETLRHLRIVMRLRSLPPQTLPNIDLAESLRINVIMCATIGMTLTMWVYDQYYINLGSPISIVFLLLLLAPAYVTNQGKLLRSL